MYRSQSSSSGLDRSVLKRIAVTLSHCFAHLLFRPLSRRMRYRIALKLGRYFAPVAKRTGYLKQPPLALGTYHEYVTASILQSLTQCGIEFDPQIDVKGSSTIPADGAIFISGHFWLNFVFLRWLHDQQRRFSVFLLLGVDDWRIMGTREQMSTLAPEKRSLIRAKDRVRSGELVVAAIDGLRPLPNWRKLNCNARDIYVSDALLKSAERFGCPVVFFETHLDDNGEIVANVQPASSADAERTFDEYERFLLSTISARHAESFAGTILQEPAA
jgi:hypothetical protein